MTHLSGRSLCETAICIVFTKQRLRHTENKDTTNIPKTKVSLTTAIPVFKIHAKVPESAQTFVLLFREREPLGTYLRDAGPNTVRIFYTFYLQTTRCPHGAVCIVALAFTQITHCKNKGNDHCSTLRSRGFTTLTNSIIPTDISDSFIGRFQ